MTNKDNKIDDLIKQVAEKIGINVLLFQSIEKGLKIILPFVSKSDDSEKISEEVKKQKEKLKLQTLGGLVNTFKNSISVNYYVDGDLINDSDVINDTYSFNYFKEIVDERNKLIHNFDFSKLNIKEDCEKCLIELEKQRKEAFNFYKEIYLLIYTVLSILHKNHEKSNEKIKLQHKEVKKIILTIIGETEYIDEKNPCYTIWENTEIVKLLKLAETETEKINNMTLLPKAGKFIKSKNRECTAKKYGVKTLKDILKVSGLFEIIELDKGFILYKSQ